MRSRSQSFSFDTFCLSEYSKFRWMSSGRNVLEESKMFVRYDIVSECSMFDGFRGARNSNRTRKKYIYVISTTPRTYRWLFCVCLGSLKKKLNHCQYIISNKSNVWITKLNFVNVLRNNELVYSELNRSYICHE
jgi:hypothetical protein